MKAYLAALLPLLLLSPLAFLPIEQVPAQDSTGQTILSVEILLPRNATDIVKAQQWGRIFDKLGYGVRISKPVLGDKPKIEETKRGNLRLVKAIGELDREGTLNFPGQTYSMTETEQLKAWLNELEKFGAQGNPQGQQLWGLSQQQFEDLVKGMATPLTEATKGKTLAAAVQSLPIPRDYPIVVDPGVRDQFDKKESEQIMQEVKNISVGSALAGLLQQHGFGFIPVRTPQGKIELTVKSLDDLTNAWPIGWKLDDAKPRNQVAPALFKFVQTGFDGASLEQVLDAIATQTETPIVINYAACAQRNIDPSSKLVSYPKKQTAWAVVLNSVVRQANLTQSLRQDEAGNPLVWVTPFVPYTISD